MWSCIMVFHLLINTCTKIDDLEWPWGQAKYSKAIISQMALQIARMPVWYGIRFQIRNIAVLPMRSQKVSSEKTIRVFFATWRLSCILIIDLVCRVVVHLMLLVARSHCSGSLSSVHTYSQRANNHRQRLLTLWRPLLPFRCSYKASCARPG